MTETRHHDFGGRNANETTARYDGGGPSYNGPPPPPPAPTSRFPDDNDLHGFDASTDLIDENESYLSAIGGRRGRSCFEHDDQARRHQQQQYYQQGRLGQMMADMGYLQPPLPKKRRVGVVSTTAITNGASHGDEAVVVNDDSVIGTTSSSSSSSSLADDSSKINGGLVGLSAAASVSSSSSSSSSVSSMNEERRTMAKTTEHEHQEVFTVEPTAVTFPRHYEHLGELYSTLLSNVNDQNLVGIVDNVRALCRSIAITTTPTLSTTGTATAAATNVATPGGNGVGYGRREERNRLVRYRRSINSTGAMAVTPNDPYCTNDDDDDNQYGWSSSLPHSLEIPSLNHCRNIDDDNDDEDDYLDAATDDDDDDDDIIMDGVDGEEDGDRNGDRDHFKACSILLSMGCHKTIINIMKKNPDYSELQYYCTRILTEFLWVPTFTTWAQSSSSSTTTTKSPSPATVIDGESYCYHPYIGCNLMEEEDYDSHNDWANGYYDLTGTVGATSGDIGMKMPLKTSSTVMTKNKKLKTSGRDEVYDAGGCNTVMQIFRRGSLESNTNLRTVGCHFLWTLVSSPSSPWGPQSSNSSVVEKLIRSTDELSTLLYMALGRPCTGGGTSTSSATTAVIGKDKHQYVIDTATALIQLLVTQCPVHLRSGVALYIHKYCRKQAARSEPNLEDSHFADWAVYNNDLFGRSTRLMKWIQEVEGEDGGYSFGAYGNHSMDADEVSYAADDFATSAARHSFHRNEQYMME